MIELSISDRYYSLATLKALPGEKLIRDDVTFKYGEDDGIWYDYPYSSCQLGLTAFGSQEVNGCLLRIINYRLVCVF